MVLNLAEYEERERIATQAVLDQWERSLKRLDMREEDRVKGVLMAYKRQWFVFEILKDRC